MSATITGKNPPKQLAKLVLLERSCSGPEQATQERRLWKVAAEAASSSFATLQLFLAVLFLAAALFSAAVAFAELSHLLGEDAIKHVTEKVLDEFNQNHDISRLPTRGGNLPRSSVHSSSSQANSVRPRPEMRAVAEEFVDHERVLHRNGREFHKSRQKYACRSQTAQDRVTDVDLAKCLVAKQKPGALSSALFLVRQ